MVFDVQVVTPDLWPQSCCLQVVRAGDEPASRIAIRYSSRSCDTVANARDADMRDFNYCCVTFLCLKYNFGTYETVLDSELF